MEVWLCMVNVRATNEWFGERRVTERSKSVRGRPAVLLSAVLLVPLLALGACGENRSEAQKQDLARSTKLVLPSNLTPPVHVGAVSGAPGAWKFSGKVAVALRQRDIPASNGIKRDSNYRLSGALTRAGAGGQQLVIRWTLVDPSGKKVGEVTQMAALPAGQKPNEDILESVADAAAESLSPIIPSSKLQTARRFDTGEPTSRSPREADDKNRVTAVGKIKSSSPLSRNLLSSRKAATKGAGDTSGSGARKGRTGTVGKSNTAIGRMRPGASALSRNLIRGGTATRGTRTADAKAGGARSAGTKNAGTKNGTSDKINTQSTTSSRPRRARTRADDPARGTMTELFGRYPTSVERKAKGDTRAPARAKREAKRAAKRKTADRPAVRRVAENRRVTGRDFTPRYRGQVADADKKTAARRSSSRYRWWVQIGAYGSAAEGEAQWGQMRARAGGVLSGKRHRVMRKNLGKKGIWYRLQVGPAGSKADALRLCRRLKASGLGCFLVGERRRVGSPPAAAKPRTAARTPTKVAPPPVTRGQTTSKAKPRAAKKPEAPKTAKPADPPAKDGTGISVYDWKTSPDKNGDSKEPPLSTRPGLPGLTK